MQGFLPVRLLICSCLTEIDCFEICQQIHCQAQILDDLRKGFYKENPGRQLSVSGCNWLAPWGHYGNTRLQRLLHEACVQLCRVGLNFFNLGLYIFETIFVLKLIFF